MYDIERHNNNFFLVINITDYGKTIINNVQDYFMNMHSYSLSDMDCIAWAMKNGHTTRFGSGGYGLPTLIDYVRNVDGELLIFSGSCMYALKGNHENILKARGNFMGTSVSMKIPLCDNTKALLYDRDNNQIISINLNLDEI